MNTPVIPEVIPTLEVVPAVAPAIAEAVVSVVTPVEPAVAPVVEPKSASANESLLTQLRRAIFGGAVASVEDQIFAAFEGEDRDQRIAVAKEFGADGLRAVEIALDLKKERDRTASVEIESGRIATEFATFKADTLAAKTVADAALETEKKSVAELTAKLTLSESAAADSVKALAEMRASGHSGPLPIGAPGANATTGSNPWQKGQENFTNQARMLKDHPELAKQMKAAAGVRG